VTQPGDAIARQAFAVQPRIELRDPDGGIVSGAVYKVRVANAVAEPHLLGNSYVRVSSGYHQFTDLRFERPGSGYFITFQLFEDDDSSVSDSTLVSDFFNVGLPFSGMHVSSRPRDMVAGTTMDPAPSVQIQNSDGQMLFVGDNVVFVSIREISDEPLRYPPLKLRGAVSAFSCCRAPNCLQLQRKMKIECDCAHEDAAKCSVPQGGIVTFYNFTINKVGTHVLEYKHVEILQQASDSAEEIIVTTQVRDTIGFSISAGAPSSLAIVDTPLSVDKGNNTGDHLFLSQMLYAYVQMYIRVCVM